MNGHPNFSTGEHNIQEKSGGPVRRASILNLNCTTILYLSNPGNLKPEGPPRKFRNTRVMQIRKL